MNPVRALCFDLDKTLLDCGNYEQLVVQTCEKLSNQCIGLDMLRLIEVNRNIRQEYGQEVTEKWTLGILDGRDVSLEVWRRTLSACGCRDDSVAQFAMQTNMQLELDSMRLYDDVQELFDVLKTAQIPLALITNGGADTQRNKLKTLGMEKWFDAIVISGEVGVAKPDALIFGLALDKLGIEPEYVWHVGDDLTTDIAGAKAASLTSVWLNRNRHARNHSQPVPDYEFHNLRDLWNHSMLSKLHHMI